MWYLYEYIKEVEKCYFIGFMYEVSSNIEDSCSGRSNFVLKYSKLESRRVHQNKFLLSAASFLLVLLFESRVYWHPSGCDSEDYYRLQVNAVYTDGHFFLE